MDWSVITPAVIAAAVLSVVLEWFPGVAGWWDGLTSAKRTTINALLVALISGFVVYGKCRLWGAVCPASWWSAIGEIAVVLLLAAASNQATHAMTRRELFGRAIIR